MAKEEEADRTTGWHEREGVIAENRAQGEDYWLMSTLLSRSTLGLRMFLQRRRWSSISIWRYEPLKWRRYDTNRERSMSAQFYYRILVNICWTLQRRQRPPIHPALSMRKRAHCIRTYIPKACRHVHVEPLIMYVTTTIRLSKHIEGLQPCRGCNKQRIQCCTRMQFSLTRSNPSRLRSSGCNLQN